MKNYDKNKKQTKKHKMKDNVKWTKNQASKNRQFHLECLALRKIEREIERNEKKR